MTAGGNEGPRRVRLEGGREVRAVARRRQHTLVAVAIFVLLCAGAAAALAFTAAPAHASEAWQHKGATGCVVPCHHNGRLTVTDASCIACHAGRVSVPGYTCWSCHVPGQDTSSLSSPSSACSQDCHLYSRSDKGYTVAFTHGACLTTAPPATARRASIATRPASRSSIRAATRTTAGRPRRRRPARTVTTVSMQSPRPLTTATRARRATPA